MKCAHCRNKAIYSKYRLCREHFIKFYEKRVEKVLKYVDLENSKFLVAVSGGKDSAAAAYVMKKFAKNVELFYINLGIPTYSNKSFEAVKALSEKLGLKLHIVDLNQEVFTIKEIKLRLDKKQLYGSVCGLCGLTKRYITNKFAYENGFDYVVTGHNLDDELSFIFLNLKNQDLDQLFRIGPITKTSKESKLVGRVKPLYYLTEKENMIYSFLHKLPVYHGECPFAVNNTQIKMKKVLNEFESNFPGFKVSTLKSFRKLLKTKESSNEISFCKKCGFPTSKDREYCRFCMLELKFKKDWTFSF